MNKRVLQALHQIHPVGNGMNPRIELIQHRYGSVGPANELMAKRVKWAEKAGYAVMSTDVPQQYAPYNAVIRIDALGTEDRNRDYLAHLHEVHVDGGDEQSPQSNTG